MMVRERICMSMIDWICMGEGRNWSSLRLEILRFCFWCVMTMMVVCGLIASPEECEA